MPPGERLRLSRVEHDGSPRPQLGHLLDVERGRLGECAEQRGAAHVLAAHALPVGRNRRQVLQVHALAHEHVLAHEPAQHRVRAPLVADGGRQPRADVAPAERARHVGREDLDVVGQLQDLGLQHLAHRGRALARLLCAAEEVRPGHVPDEQRPAREQQRRIIADRAVVHEQAHVLGGVTRRVEHLERTSPISTTSPSRTGRWS